MIIIESKKLKSAKKSAPAVKKDDIPIDSSDVVADSVKKSTSEVFDLSTSTSGSVDDDLINASATETEFNDGLIKDESIMKCDLTSVFDNAISSFVVKQKTSPKRKHAETTDKVYIFIIYENIKDIYLCLYY